MKNKKVWFVTGCSKGLGHALVNELLEQGYMVSATSRNKQALIEAFGNESEQFLPLSMNLADEESVKTALKKTVLKFGRVDVVVNNAGYTHLATIEEMSDKAVRELFDINVFGLLNVIRALSTRRLRFGYEQQFSRSTPGACFGVVGEEHTAYT